MGNKIKVLDERGVDTLIAALKKQIKPDPPVYGFEIDIEEADPSKSIKYIGANESFKPAKMNFSKKIFDYGDWADLWFIKNLKPCVININGEIEYELSKNDYKRKSTGEAIDVKPDGKKHVMVGIPTVWIKVDDTVKTKPKIYFCEKKIDDGFKAHAHVNVDNKVIPYIYIAAYAGSTFDNRPQSISNSKNNKNYSFSEAIDYVESFSARGWGMDAYSDKLLIRLLSMLITKTAYLTTAFGEYSNDNPEHYGKIGYDEDCMTITGLHDKGGLFYSIEDKGFKAFGIENPYGNRQRYIQGMCYKKDNICIKMDPYGGYGDIDLYKDIPISGAKGIINMKAKMVNDMGFFDTDSSGGKYKQYICDSMYYPDNPEDDKIYIAIQSSVSTTSFSFNDPDSVDGSRVSISLTFKPA